jgi:nondiscriminating glutamyl-tRNA synthetase
VQKPVRVRFAPSPTGKLHIGGARTALFNWAYARHFGGKFLLRIEDTDPERSTKEHEVQILAGLRWLGLDWDEGPDIGGPHAPYHQSLRIARHKELARVLFDGGKAYRCFCSRERIEQLNAEQVAKKERIAYDGLCRRLARADSDARAKNGESFVLRFAVPSGETRFLDHVRGDVVFDNREVEDWVMVRSDDNPTYNFVVVCDDVDMEITHVFRGEEHLVNTPKQVLLYKALGQEPPEFGHLPLMLGTDRKKLSKRTGDTALQDYIDRGFPRDAIVNFLCLQGWALDGATEIFTIDDLVAKFDIKDVSKAGAIFDIEKFRWLAGEYIRRDTLEHFAALCAPFVVRAGLMTESELRARHAWYLSIVAGEKERVHTYAELAEHIAYLFAADEKVVYDESAEKNARKHENRITVLRSFLEWLRPRLAQGVDAAALRDAAKLWVGEQGIKMPVLFQPLRCALSGLAGGPDMFDTMHWLGAERTLRRIEIAIERLA